MSAFHLVFVVWLDPATRGEGKGVGRAENCPTADRIHRRMVHQPGEVESHLARGGAHGLAWLWLVRKKGKRRGGV